MNSRERIRLTLNHKEPDRIAIDLGSSQSGISYETYIGVKKILGIESEISISEPIQGLAKIDEEVLKQFNVDTRYIFPKTPRNWDGTINEDGFFLDNWGIKWCHSFYDEWGIKWHRPSNSHYYDMVDRKLKGIDDKSLEEFSWPIPDEPGRVDNLEKEIRYLFENTNYAIFSSGFGLFELSWQIYGMEDYFIATITKTKSVEKLLDKILEVLMGLYGKFLDIVGEYLDCFMVYSDLGSQRGPIIAPKFYRDIIKDRDKELIKLIKDKSNAKVALHSCGAVYDFIPDIIDAGYDVLNPIQTNAYGMDSKKLKREFGKDIVFWGAIDTQRILPFGTVEDVKNEVRHKINDLGKGGGYIFAPCHNIQANTPPENVIAMFEEVKEIYK